MINQLTKFSEQELKHRNIGKVLDAEPRTQAASGIWKTKRLTYEAEGVIKNYRSLYNSFLAILIPYDQVTAYPDKYACSKCAQIMIDAHLLQASRGTKTEIPNEVFLHKAKKVKAKSTEIELYDAALFENKGTVTENEKVRWIFENMQMEGIEPADAPSMGAYTLLMELRGNQQARQKFYDSSWLKLLAKEDAEKTGKLEDTGKDTIQLIERLEAALPEEIK